MWNYTIEWVSENAGLVFALSVLTLCVGSVAGYWVYDRRASVKAYWEHRRTIRIQRGLLMGKKKQVERRAYLKQLLGDVITHGLEEAWFAGKLTAEEKNSLYRAIGKTHGIHDLIPVMTPEQLKSAIKGRRARGDGISAGPIQEHPADGGRPATASASAPTATAPPPVPASGGNVIQAAKKFGAKALSKLQKAS